MGSVAIEVIEENAKGLCIWKILASGRTVSVVWSFISRSALGSTCSESIVDIINEALLMLLLKGARVIINCAGDT